jgi:hypothetical protein
MKAFQIARPDFLLVLDRCLKRSALKRFLCKLVEEEGSLEDAPKDVFELQEKFSQFVADFTTSDDGVLHAVSIIRNLYL